MRQIRQFQNSKMKLYAFENNKESQYKVKKIKSKRERTEFGVYGLEASKTCCNMVKIQKKYSIIRNHSAEAN